VRNRGKRKDGSTKWEARLYTAQPGPNPTQRIAKTFRSRRDAHAWLTEQNHSQLQGTHASPSSGKTTFQDLTVTWRTTFLAIEPKTAGGYEQILKSHLLPEFGNVPIRDITPHSIQAFVSSLSQRREPGTVRNVYAALRNCLNTAVRLRMLSTNPCQGVRLPRSPREQQLFLTPAEIQLLATEISRPVAMHGGKPVRLPSGEPRRQKPHPSHQQHKILVLTAAYTGLRSGELLALRREDVDLLHGRLFVRRALKTYADPNNDGREVFEFGPTKTHQIRTVSLPKFLVGLLEEHLSESVLISRDPGALIFPSATDPSLPMRHNLWYRRHFKPAVRRALPKEKHGLRFHDLRHTCASLLIAQGVHAKAIQERLGHSSIGITMDRYGHLMESAYAAVADALDVAYNTPAPTLRAVTEAE
jgi:integrase